MRLDLKRDYLVRLPCGCEVVFTGESGHNLNTYRAGCKGAVHGAIGAHERECRAFAKRFRATQMERIGPGEPDHIEGEGDDV